MNFTLCLTHACNMRCTYCYAGDKHGGSMTWETARRAVDFSLEQVMEHARSRGRHPVTQLGFFGGEPLLQWDLLTRTTEYTEDACAKPGILLKKTVTTNMSLLDSGRADWLIGHGFEVGLSLDGTARRHNLLRRMADGSESHALCADALRYFRDAPDRCVVILVIDPLNVSGLADSIAWLVDQGMTGFILNPNYDADWSADGLARWSGEMEMVAKQLAGWYREGKTIRIDVLDSKIDARIRGASSRCGECGYGGGEIAIAPEVLAADLDANWEVLGEAIQTVIRAEVTAGRSSIADPYAVLKDLTRGRRVGAAELAEFIDGLDIGSDAKARLRALTPASYIGLADELVDRLAD